MGLCTQDYRSLCGAHTIYANLVNIDTCARMHAHRQTAFDQLISGGFVNFARGGSSYSLPFLIDWALVHGVHLQLTESVFLIFSGRVNNLS